MPAPTFAAADAVNASGAGGTATQAFNPGTEADTFVVVDVKTFSRSLNAATWDGAAMTLSAQYVDHNGYEHKLAYLHIGTGAGSKDLVLTLSAAGTVQFNMVAYKNVDAAAPFSDFTTNFGFDGLPTWTVDSATGDLVVALLDTLTTPTPTSPAVQQFVEGVNDGSIWTGFYVWDEAGATSVTLNGTTSGGNNWGGSAFSLKASAGGGASAEGGGMLLGSRRNRLTIP